MSDIFSFSKSCTAPASDALHVVEKVLANDEKNCYVLRKIVDGLGSFRGNFLTRPDCKDALQLVSSFHINYTISFSKKKIFIKI